MNYISVSEAAGMWQVSERSVRNYCAEGKIPGAVLEGKTWKVPADSEKPIRKKRVCKVPTALLDRLRQEKEMETSGGVYHKLMVDMTFQTNHIEGSSLTYEQTRNIFENNTLWKTSEAINVDDIIVVANHFQCIDLVIDMANYVLTENIIKHLHYLFESGTSDSRRAWFAIGEYKHFDNQVGGANATKTRDVSKEIKALLKNYNQKKKKTLEDIVEFHVAFEKIHPFQDGNGPVGRLIMLKECLHSGVTPFIIEDDLIAEYYRGLKAWDTDRAGLIATCKEAQKRFKSYLDQYGLKHQD